MAERQIESPERKVPSLEKTAGERLAELERNREHKKEVLDNDLEASIEQAHAEATAEALFTKEYSKEPQQQSAVERDKTVGVISKQEREHTYKRTLKDIQSHFNGPERTFSKIIHNKPIERASDLTASTIARPNSILFGSIFAFLGVLGVYLYARYMGFALTGFETIAAFIIGWLIGIIVDFLRVIAKRPR